jgi:uncharacterized membrane protein
MNEMTMGWTEYWLAAAGTWFTGFFPLAEIYVAIPVGIATGLDPLSVVFWAVLGNFMPVPLIHYGYEQMLRWAWLRKWLARLDSESLQASVNRHGYWFVLVMTPWAGVWLMAVAAKALRLRASVLFWATFKSITIYAIALTFLITAGIDWWTAG